MSQHKKTLKPLSLAIGAAFVATMATSTFATAATAGSNPFAMSDMHGSYTQVADSAPEGKCGANKDMKAKEGKCGKDKKKAKEGKCGKDKKKAKEGKCGKDKMPADGKCGANK